MKRAVLAVLGMSVLAWSIAGRADEGRKLGDPGTIALGGQAGVSVVGDDMIGSMKTQHWSASGALLGDVFVAKGLSLGGTAAGSHMFVRGGDSMQSTKTIGNAVMVAARVGYYASISERVAFWPVLQVGTAHHWTKAESSNGLSESIGPAIGWTAGLDAQILVHLTEHLYLRAVPGGLAANSTRVDQGGRISRSRSLSIGWNGGMMFGLGGWF